MLTTPWRLHRAALTTDQVLIVGDVHGRADALARLLRHLSALPSHGADRELVFLGDLIDRGPASLHTLHLAWDAHSFVDRWLLLPGNHELMLLDALDDDLKGGSEASDTANARMWRRNGGTTLLAEVDPEGRLPPPQALRALREALPPWFEPLMRNAPSHHTVGHLLLVHAGLDPRQDQAAFLARPGQLAGDDHWAWIREPFLAWQGGWGGDGLQIVVHGHTPATTEPIRTPEKALAVLDRIDSHWRLCLDAGATAIEQVAAAEFIDGRYRLHVASGAS